MLTKPQTLVKPTHPYLTTPQLNEDEMIYLTIDKHLNVKVKGNHTSTYLNDVKQRSYALYRLLQPSHHYLMKRGYISYTATNNGWCLYLNEKGKRTKLKSYQF